MVTSITFSAEDLLYFCTMWKHVFWALALVSLSAYGQHPVEDTSGVNHAPSHYQNLADYMRKGQFEFMYRSFGMATINRGDLLDYHTHAVGGGLGYYSPMFKGFHFGVSGFFAFQLYAHNIAKPDPTTGGGNRYEVLLYDMNDLDNTADLDRLEDFYLAYDYKGFSAMVGRHRVNTPLLNEQDNRMRHNSFSGITLQYRHNRWSAFAGGYTAATMRGTVNWYSIEESFGVYPFGRNPQGTPSEYRGNVSTDGIAILGAAYTHPDRYHVQLWNYTAENVFNLSQAQLEGRVKTGDGHLLYGAQGFYQTALNHGGNPEPEAAYIDPSSSTWAGGGMLGYRSGKNQVSLNYLRIGSGGRFLFPREWGREQFFASLPRERYEGNGDVHAATVKYEHWFRNEGLHGMVGAGWVQNPELDNFALNKYGVPSYYHFVGSLDYRFRGYLDGLHLMVLAVQKTAMNPNQVPDEFRLNRVDMWNLNFVVNYAF